MSDLNASETHLKSSRFSEASKTSFESLDVKKISPIHKYDVNDMLDFYDRQSSSEFIFEYFPDEFQRMGAQNFTDLNRVVEISSPAISAVCQFNEYATRPNKGHIFYAAKQDPRGFSQEQLLMSDSYYNKSSNNMTLNNLSDSIQSHLDALKKQIKTRQLTTLNNSSQINYMMQEPNKLAKLDTQAVESQLIKHERPRTHKIGDNVEQEDAKDYRTKVSSINNKLYLDIFIPCAN